MVLEILFLRVAAVLVGCMLAAYSDARTGLIFDRITYPMIAFGVILGIIEGQWLFLGIGGVVFAIGYLVYYLGKVGGGDVKLITGIAFLLPFYRNGFFLLNSLFAASLLAVSFYSVYYVSRYARKGIEWKENSRGIVKAVVFLAAIIAYILWAALLGAIRPYSALALAFPMALASVFIAFERGIRKRFFLMNVRLGKLEEDEVVASEFLSKKAKRALGLGFKGVLGEKEIEKLGKSGINKVPVFRALPPFGPFIFLGCAIAAIVPDLIGALFG